MKTLVEVHRALTRFLDRHLEGLDTDQRIGALATYCQGLMLEGCRKSLVAMATRLDPDNVEGCRQRMHRALHRGRFVHQDVFERLQQTVWTRKKALVGYCIDDTGFAKKGEHSVGTQRQYSGTLGKIGNCQVAVSLHAVGPRQSTCLDATLYLPESWATDGPRRARAGVPEEVSFTTKHELALEQLRRARATGGPVMPVIADAGYGDSRAFREAIDAMGLPYLMAVSSATCVWPPGANPVRPAPSDANGRPPTRVRDAAGLKPVRTSVLAMEAWEAGRFRTITWGQGSKGLKTGSFCLLTVRSAERHAKGMPPSTPLQLLIERDRQESTGFKYYLTTLSAARGLRRLVTVAKLRWRIERDYQDMKQHLGLDAYEGRTWGGFHRHFAMVALMHAFLSLHREAFSPSANANTLVDLTGLPSTRPDGPPALAEAVSHLSEDFCASRPLRTTAAAI